MVYTGRDRNGTGMHTTVQWISVPFENRVLRRCVSLSAYCTVFRGVRCKLLLQKYYLHTQTQEITSYVYVCRAWQEESLLNRFALENCVPANRHELHL